MTESGVMKKRIPVTGAVLLRDGLILAAQRGSDKALPGYWEFPGGKIEPGESPEDSLARELKEELLCEAIIGERITTTSYEYSFGLVELSTYWCELIKGEPQLTEHVEIRWLKPEELEHLKWAPADIPTAVLISEQLSKQ